MHADYVLIDIATGDRTAGEAAVDSASKITDEHVLVHLQLRTPAVALSATPQSGAADTHCAILGRDKHWSVAVYGPRPKALLIIAVYE